MERVSVSEGFSVGEPLSSSASTHASSSSAWVGGEQGGEYDGDGEAERESNRVGDGGSTSKLFERELSDPMRSAPCADAVGAVTAEGVGEAEEEDLWLE